MKRCSVDLEDSFHTQIAVETERRCLYTLPNIIVQSGRMSSEHQSSAMTALIVMQDNRTRSFAKCNNE